MFYNNTIFFIIIFYNNKKISKYNYMSNSPLYVALVATLLICCAVSIFMGLTLTSYTDSEVVPVSLCSASNTPNTIPNTNTKIATPNTLYINRSTITNRIYEFLPAVLCFVLIIMGSLGYVIMKSKQNAVPE